LTFEISYISLGNAEV